MRERTVFFVRIMYYWFPALIFRVLKRIFLAGYCTSEKQTLFYENITSFVLEIVFFLNHNSEDPMQEDKAD
jgi:hypothetical protein